MRSGVQFSLSLHWKAWHGVPGFLFQAGEENLFSSDWMKQKSPSNALRCKAFRCKALPRESPQAILPVPAPESHLQHAASDHIPMKFLHVTKMLTNLSDSGSKFDVNCLNADHHETFCPDYDNLLIYSSCYM